MAGLEAGSTRSRKTLADLGSSPCDTVFDFAAERGKIHRLGQERLGAAFQGFSLGIRIAVGGDHNDGNVWTRRLRLRQKLKAAQSGYVDVGQDQNQ
jgi:hypothetical protein